MQTTTRDEFRALMRERGAPAARDDRETFRQISMYSYLNYVDTPLTEAIFSDPAKLAQVIAHTPMGRLPTPDDVAQAVLFLASDAAASITGHVLAVDSGYLAR